MKGRTQLNTHSDVMTESIAFQARGVRKQFPGVLALKDVDLTVRSGEVMGLVGENGAGKSTLIKVMVGALTPDAGSLEVGGRVTTVPDPSSAARLGISVIHQERQVAPHVSVAENVFLGRLAPGRGPLRWSDIYERARRRLEAIGLDVDPRTPMKSLTVAEQQEVEIARALTEDANLVIMDEPTAALSQNETEALFKVIARLKERNTAVLYVSHHLEEVFRVADRVTVMRDGQVVGVYETKSLTVDSLTGLMFDRDVSSLERSVRSSARAHRGEVILKAQGLSVGTSLRGLDMEAHRGEIVCITGGIGSGRRELARCLVGAIRPDSGEVLVQVNGRAKRVHSPRSALMAGIGFIPADRKREGVFLDLDLVDNVHVSKSSLSKNPLIFPAVRSREVSSFVQDLSIRTASLRTPTKQLSGGNQQKVLMARLLCINASILLLDEPTAGVDVNTKVEIYQILKRLAGEGKAVIVLSSDLTEVKLLADRVLVLRRGTVAGELEGDAISEERILKLASAD